MPDEILTLPDVAQLPKVAEKSVYTMAQRAEIPAFKLRGQWRFKRADIYQWIERQKIAQHEVEFESANSLSDVKRRTSRGRDDH